MLIEISLLPVAVQKQILAIEQGQVVQFASHGKVIGELKPKDSTCYRQQGYSKTVLSMAWNVSVRLDVSGNDVFGRYNPH